MRSKMKPWKKILVPMILVCLQVGCSAKRDFVVPPPEDPLPVVAPQGNRDLIVLLADPEGKTGVVQVTTQGGSQVLDKSGYATEIVGVGFPPTAPLLVNESEINGIFGSALSTQPDGTGRFVSFILHFGRNTIRLTPESKSVLTEMVKTIRNRNPSEVFVVGHTDRVGAGDYNLDLSARRACGVRDLLVSGGIQPGVLVVSFHGETIPLVNTEDEVAEPLNRRVEVIVR